MLQIKVTEGHLGSSLFRPQKTKDKRKEKTKEKIRFVSSVNYTSHPLSQPALATLAVLSSAASRTETAIHMSHCKKRLKLTLFHGCVGYTSWKSKWRSSCALGRQHGPFAHTKPP